MVKTLPACVVVRLLKRQAGQISKSPALYSLPCLSTLILSPQLPSHCCNDLPVTSRGSLINNTDENMSKRDSHFSNTCPVHWFPTSADGKGTLLFAQVKTFGGSPWNFRFLLASFHLFHHEILYLSLQNASRGDVLRPPPVATTLVWSTLILNSTARAVLVKIPSDDVPSCNVPSLLSPVHAKSMARLLRWLQSHL